MSKSALRPLYTLVATAAAAAAAAAVVVVVAVVGNQLSQLFCTCVCLPTTKHKAFCARRGPPPALQLLLLGTRRSLFAVSVAFVQEDGFEKSNFSIRETVPGLIRPGIVFSYQLQLVIHHRLLSDLTCIVLGRRVARAKKLPQQGLQFVQ